MVNGFLTARGSSLDTMAELRIAATQACRESLRSLPLSRVAERLDCLGLAGTDWFGLVRSVDLSPLSQEPIRELKRVLLSFGLRERDVEVERFLLLHAALETLGRLDEVPVSASVKELLCEEFRFLAEAPEKAPDSFFVGQASFVEMAKLTTGRRFPAGQLQWEVSGLPRQWLAKVPRACLGRLLYLVALKLRGFRPLCDLHFNRRQRNSFIMLEKEWNRSYYRLARSLELQPALKGMMAASWIYSPETLRIHPELGWLSRNLEENGALVTDLGPAPPDSGFLVGSALRRRLYESGAFKPRLGLVIWPRDEMLEWAARHPQPDHPRSQNE